MRTPLLALMVTLLVAACAGAADVSRESAEARSTVLPTAQPSASASGPETLRPSEGFAVGDARFSDPTRTVVVPVLVADDPDLRATGLMRRTDLPADAGMLFVFDTPTRGAFWMKNTLLPLSIAFVGQDGTVQQLMDMEPCSSEPCPRYAPDDPYLYAVEVNQGFFADSGIAVGWRLDVRDVLGGAR